MREISNQDIERWLAELSDQRDSQDRRARLLGHCLVGLSCALVSSVLTIIVLPRFA